MIEPSKRCVQCGILKEPTLFRPYTHSRGKPNAQMARYRICRDCEALNSKYRRAQERGDTEEFERINELYKALEALGFRTPRSAKVKSTDDTTAASIRKIMEHHGVDVTTQVKREPNHTPPARTDLHAGGTIAAREEATRVKPIQHQPHVVIVHGTDGRTYEELSVESTIPRIARAPEPGPEIEVPSELQHWLDVDPAEWEEADLSPEYLQETVYESLKAKYRPQTGVNRDTYTPIYDDTYRAVLNDILRKFDDYEEEQSQKEYEEEVMIIDGYQDDEQH